MEKNEIQTVKNIFPLDFAKYLSYSALQKNSKVLNVEIRSLRICSKSVTKALYRNNVLVSQCIFKLVCHYNSCRLSEIRCE